MAKNYLSPRFTTDAEPCADLNVKQVGDCCLDVHLKNHSVLVGRVAGAWWVIWIGVLTYIFFVLWLTYAGSNIVELLFIPLGISLLLAVPILLWANSVGKNQCPVRFCRKNRKVYIYIKNKLYTLDWDNIHIYTSSQALLSATGAPYSDSQLHLELEEGRHPPTIFLFGTSRSKTIIPKHLEALALWEYIRVYMEKGPEKLPAPSPRHPYGTLTEVRAFWDPWPVAKGDDPFWKMVGLFFFPLRVFAWIIGYPTETIYYYFHQKFIKPQPFPEALNIPALNHCGLEQVDRPLYPEMEASLMKNIKDQALREEMIRKFRKVS